ncbi:MAG: hypothetical protein Kow00103_09350 [Candidatus Caldatribacteriota bacterium]
MNIKVFFWGIYIIYSIIVFLLSSRPDVGVKQLFYGQDKIIHFTLYALHSYLGMLALNERNFNKKFKPYLLILVISFSFSLFNEVYQCFIPEREFSLGDIIANFLGITICLLLIYGLKVKKSAWH